MSLEEEIAHLAAENGQLKEQLGLALEQLAQTSARVTELEAKIEQLEQAGASSGAPSFIKPSTPNLHT